MGRNRKKKRSLKKSFTESRKRVNTMSENDERMIESEGQEIPESEMESELSSTQNPSECKACDAVQNAQAAVDVSLEATGDSFDNTFESQRWNTAEAETDAAVQAEMVDKVQCDALGGEQTIESEGQDISMEQMDNELAADVPETNEAADESVEVAQDSVDETLEATGISFDDTNEWQRENTAEAETDAAVEAEDVTRTPGKELPDYLL